ncbi:TlpA family protein disulfide reductase [Mesorhizobium sp. M7A.F.Ca.US.001.04.1.1]|uniref:TlpA family protein disulfide reductase n=1 Tax=unclassified Mesorhizobium TaxID=325217 RepID=UPI000FCA0F8A|nr:MULTISPECIES: TlpA disulfide reductase family protein [unclassified Mesorhizobium]RUY28052.1 TlpA family protein disulfide reductase [Mesorhizobium sp. M7A.F.Ca.US.001.04.2.1]RUY34695.1 TlpA family protein disulfide reductase [Mesorhizobium sp. M7A.F.Ca.US.001.04.1.1]
MKILALALFGAILAVEPATAIEPPQNFAVHEAPLPVPEISFEDAGGQPRTLADFRGKVVLLNIWATWCAPCRKEMPTLDRLQAKLGGPDFEVVALSIDRSPDMVKQFFTEIGIAHLALNIDTSSKAMFALGVFGLPTTLLIDSKGREVGRLIGPAEWDAPDMVAFIRGYVAAD